MHCSFHRRLETEPSTRPRGATLSFPLPHSRLAVFARSFPLLSLQPIALPGPYFYAPVACISPKSVMSSFLHPITTMSSCLPSCTRKFLSYASYFFTAPCKAEASRACSPLISRVTLPRPGVQPDLHGPRRNGTEGSPYRSVTD
jgi:hypothetical protein